MSNTLTHNPNDVSWKTQLKPAWYSETAGNPNVVMKIPRRMLSSATVPRPTGNTLKLAGWEFTTSAYPKSGKSGLLQFLGSIDNSVLEEGFKNGSIEIIDLKGGISRLLMLKKVVKK